MVPGNNKKESKNKEGKGEKEKSVLGERILPFLISVLEFVVLHYVVPWLSFMVESMIFV